MKSMKLAVWLLAIMMLASFVSAEEQISVDIGGGVMATMFHPDCSREEVKVDGVGCVAPKFQTKTIVKRPTDVSATASSVADIDPIRVNNPWAAAGQPVVVEFTLENIGDEFQYPFNQIPLIPDAYVLTIAADKDIGVRTPDGQFIDVWNFMSSGEKIAFLLKLSFASAKEEFAATLQGRTCGFVDVRKHMPDRVTKYVDERSGVPNLPINMWECVKMVDLPFFADEIKTQEVCRNSIDSACIANINKQFSNMVDSTVTVLLASEKKSGLSKGECARPYLTGGFFKKAQLDILNKRNIVICSIGNDGLQPGEEVTMRFVALVPADAPVVPPKEVEKVTELKQGYTQSVVCQDERYANACHSIYAAVYPAANENFIRWVVGSLTEPFQVIGCSFEAIFKEGTYNQCRSTKGQGAEGVGTPIWEGAGTFYVLGPALRGTINLILFAVYVSTLLASFSIGRKN